MMEDRIVIIGVGQIPVKEHWDIGIRSLGSRAVRAALADCGLQMADGLFVGNAFSPILSHQSNLAPLIADASGMTGAEAYGYEAGGAGGGAAFRAAVLAVRSGFLDTAVALGVEKITDNTGSMANATQDLMLNYEYETMMGMTIPSGAALMARRYQVEYGLTDRDIFDCMSLNAYNQACGNPNALYHIRLDDTKLQNQPLSNAPLGMYDCSALSDGAAAAVITRESLIPDGLSHEPITVLGSANAIESLSLHDRHNLLRYRSSEASAAKAFRQADFNISDIDIWELWDAFAIDGILSRESIGLAPSGEGWKPDGRYYSTMGGCLGRGNPLSASGMYQIAEAVLQLQNRAGACQVENARTAFTQCIGGLGATAVTHILSRLD